MNAIAERRLYQIFVASFNNNLEINLTFVHKAEWTVGHSNVSIAGM